MRYLLFAAFLLSPGAFAQSSHSDNSPNALIQKALEHFNANKKQSYAYTCIELWHNQNFNKRGKLKTDQSAKFESVFIEDLPYLRKIEENGKPLTGKAARREEEKYEAAVETRKGMSLEQKQAEMRVKNLTFPIHLNLLLKLYTYRTVGTESINGRTAIHISCIPRADVKAKNEEESEALSEQVQIWIDVQDKMLSRFDGELIAPVNGMTPGSEASVSFLPVDSVWLPSHILVRGEMKRGKSIVDFKTDLTYSNFKKFRVDIRMLDNDNDEIPALH